MFIKPHWPLEIQSPISGTFGEYRTYNLHMGLDFKTYGLNGVKVLATFDGYIQFLSQKNKGYGLSIHLYSPEMELTTKYAHLSSLLGEDPTLEFLRNAIILLEGKNEFQYQLPPNQFPVSRGKWIALSGESGTGGPHLHMEFRNQNGFINPLPFLITERSDLYHPTILKIIWEVESIQKSIELDAIESYPGVYQLKESPLYGTGKARLKIMGYDWISSQNKNNIYALEVKLNNESIYRNQFDSISYLESNKRHYYYDINRSSLNPPIYYYNMYDFNKGYTIDLNNYPENSQLELEAILEDASGKKSILKIPILVQNPPKKESEEESEASILVSQKKSSLLFQSKDGSIKIQIPSHSTSGSGSLNIEPTSWENENIQLPKGLPATSIAYKISSNHFNWNQKAQGEWNLGRLPSKKESLYFYDTTIRKFRGIPFQKTKNGFSFSLEKVGILGILEDNQPPTIQYVYQFSPKVHLPGSIPKGFMERYYYLSDLGSGFTQNPEVLIEGEPYPYTYDVDRKGIRLLIPHSLFKNKSHLLLEIRPSDYAGNKGEFFTEILTKFLPTEARDL